MNVHVFLDDDSRDHKTWENVLPGDVVISPGTPGYRYDRPERNPKILQQRPLLVLSRFEETAWRGSPGLEQHAQLRTFVVLSRHGVLIVTKRMNVV